MSNKAFDSVLFDQHDKFGKDAVIRAFAIDFGDIVSGSDKYGLDLRSMSNNAGFEVEHCPRWTYGNNWPRPLEPAHIPARKKHYIEEAIRKGMRVAYTWVRDDGHRVMYVWVDPIWNQLVGEQKDNCYMKGEDWICVPSVHYEYRDS